MGWGVWDGECGIGSVGEECGGSVGDGVWEGSGGVGCVRRWSVGWGVWDGECGGCAGVKTTAVR